MANPEHVEIVRKGAAAIDAWREEHPETVLDLSGAALHGVDLSWSNLTRANLDRANLTEADLALAQLNYVSLQRAQLSQADFSRASLIEADAYLADLDGTNLSDSNLHLTSLRGTDLRKANLSHANLYETDFNCASMHGAILQNVILGATCFTDVDLSTVIGLETAKHLGPSSISVDTLYMSNGKIPESFLRGCGVPEVLIEHLPSLIAGMQPIQFHSCFISHSSKDEEFAKRLHGRLEQEKLRVWYAPEDLKGGRKVDSQIDEAIRYHDKLLLMLSPDSMSSEWVRREIKKARKKEKQTGKLALFPIGLVPFGEIRDWECLDSDSGEDLAEKVREYHIPDFSCWKDHDKFEAGFAKLMADLRASVSPPSK